MERVKFIKCLIWQKLFASNPKDGDVVISPPNQVNHVVEEQFRKYELTELGLSAVHLKD